MTKEGHFATTGMFNHAMFAHMPIIRDIIYGAVSKGADMESLCRLAKVDPADLNHSDKKLDFESAYKVWELAVKLTNDNLLGLHLGETTNPSILGLIGNLMQSSPSLKDAFESVAKFGRVATNMFRYSIYKEGSSYILQFDPEIVWTRQSPGSAQQAVDQAMAGTLQVFYLLSGKKVSPMQVNFHSRERFALPEYERVFKCSLNLKAGVNQLIFANHQLASKVISYDHSLYRMFDKMLTGISRERMSKEKFSNRVRRIILTEFNGQVPPIEFLAMNLGLTTRSLQRKLKEEKITFRKLSIMIKKDIARQLLANPDLKVAYVASILGYSEASAFRRAYKTWTHSSPRKTMKLK
ncbi:MAG: helix-turn-helix domain-containing protein [Cyclobacteriaceae bacterium]|nr:helix-turn-helix domain-containing protein [Cyclobacteriaceae bacterium]